MGGLDSTADPSRAADESIPNSGWAKRVPENSMRPPSAQPFQKCWTWPGSISNQRNSSALPKRGMTPMRVPFSGRHCTIGSWPRFETSNTMGESRNTAWCSVMTKSCIITGAGTSIVTLWTSDPDASTT